MKKSHGHKSEENDNLNNIVKKYRIILFYHSEFEFNSSGVQHLIYTEAVRLNKTTLIQLSEAIDKSQSLLHNFLLYGLMYTDLCSSGPL